MITEPGLAELLENAPPRAELTQAIRDHVNGHSGIKWNQEIWGHVRECGSTACVGGFLALHLGAHPVVRHVDGRQVTDLAMVAASPGQQHGSSRNARGTDTFAGLALTDTFAGLALDLSLGEELWLFSGTRTRAEILQAMDDLDNHDRIIFPDEARPES